MHKHRKIDVKADQFNTADFRDGEFARIPSINLLINSMAELFAK
jgi:hypothetical protein